jgi:hypothetical protein
MKLKKCFLVMSTTTELNGEETSNSFLFDAYERRLYAQLMMPVSIGDKPPTLCHLMLSLTQHKVCSTPKEFWAFVAGYMEE